MKLFYHLALDRFGAECLGRFEQYLVDLVDPKKEKHQFVWAGLGEPPTRTNYWADEIPVWDHVLLIPADTAVDGDPVSFKFNRQVLADRIYDDFQWGGTLGQEVRNLNDEEPAHLFGRNVTFEVEWVLAGSLTDPVGSGVLHGLLQGFAFLRETGIHVAPAQLVVSVGAESSSIDPNRKPKDLILALGARGLLDLQENLQGHERPSLFAGPMYVIGEDAIHENMRPNRSAQISMVGLCLIGLTRVLIKPGEGDLPGQPNPFRFKISEDDRIRHGGKRYDSTQPFHALGVYAARCPADALVRLLAARACNDILKLLAQQESFGTITEWARLEPPSELAAFLKTVEQKAIGHAWHQPDPNSPLPWEPDEVAEGRWFQTTCIRRLFQPIFEDRAWERLLDTYGPERMKTLPLEDWNGAIDELSNLIEEGFVKMRGAEVQTAIRRVLVRFLNGLQFGMDEVFSTTFQTPVGLEPHRAAQALLGQVLTSVEHEKQILEKELAATPTDEAEASETARRAMLDQMRTKISRALSDLPSPMAVVLRILPVITICFGLAFAVPGFAFYGNTFTRLLGGVTLSLLGGGGLLEFMVFRVRRRMHGAFKEWLSQYKVLLMAEDRKREREAVQQTYNEMTTVLRWFAAGEEKEPPIPEIMGIPTGTPEDVGVVTEEDDEVLRPQSVLLRFPEILANAQDRFKESVTRLRELFQTSLIETNLPEIVIHDDAAFDEEYERMLGDDGSTASGPQDSDDSPVAVFAHQLVEWARQVAQNRSEEHYLLPYLDLVAGTKGVEQRRCWHRSFQIPDGAALLDSELRDACSGFQFFETVRRFIEQRGAGAVGLMRRIQEYVAGEGKSTPGQTALFNRAGSLAAPAIKAARGHPRVFYIGCSSTDPFVGDPGLANEWGRDVLSATIQVLGPLNHDDVVFYPNQENPVNSLGLAWNYFLDQDLAEAAFQPLTWKQ